MKNKLRSLILPKNPEGTLTGVAIFLCAFFVAWAIWKAVVGDWPKSAGSVVIAAMFIGITTWRIRAPKAQTSVKRSTGMNGATVMECWKVPGKK